MPMEEYVPNKIMELCLKNEISRYQLSIKTGISQSALSDIVKKKNVPTLTTIERICEAFGITMAQFFTTDGSISNLSEEQKVILRMWNDLKTEEKGFIRNCMESIKK